MENFLTKLFANKKKIEKSIAVLQQHCEQMGYDEEQELNLLHSIIEWFEAWANGEITIDHVAQIESIIGKSQTP